jgi:uncharacterized protein (DUF2267 family)
MDHDSFIGQVQERARLGSRGAAEDATRATLETLAERIPAGLADNVAAQLPREIGEHLLRVATSLDHPDDGVHMAPGEFFARVAQRVGAGYPEAVQEARAVVEVMSEATDNDLVGEVSDSLDEDLRRDLFAGTSAG